MKRKNRIETLKRELLEIDKDAIKQRRAKLLAEKGKLIEEIDTKKKPFMYKIEKLRAEIGQLEREIDIETEGIYEELRNLNTEIDEAEKEERQLTNKEKELAWLEGLEKIKKILDEYSVFIESVKIEASYSREQYLLGGRIGMSANWSTPSRITDIQPSEKTFKIKSEIAKGYRSISLRGQNYPSEAVIQVVDGIFAEEREGSRIKECPKCNADSKKTDAVMSGAYGLPQMRCPICYEPFYWKCKKCGYEWDTEPTCEHKDMLVTVAHYRPINVIIFTFKNGVWEEEKFIRKGNHSMEKVNGDDRI